MWCQKCGEAKPSNLGDKQKYCSVKGCGGTYGPEKPGSKTGVKPNFTVTRKSPEPVQKIADPVKVSELVNINLRRAGPVSKPTSVTPSGGSGDQSSPTLKRSTVETKAKLDPVQVKASFDQKLDKPVGNGKWKFERVKIYTPPRAMEVPGTSFNEVCPGQPHVNVEIVQAKIEKGLPATPVIPAVVTPTGKIALSDKHHTFVACMAMGRPVKLALVEGMPPAGYDDWRGCKWKGFEKPGNAAQGFSLSPEESKLLEGEPVVDPEWKSIVPWLKNAPKEDKEKVGVLCKSIKPLVGMKRPNFNKDFMQSCEESCAADPGLAQRLYELVKFNSIEIKLRKKAKGSTGGDWIAAENAIYLDVDDAEIEPIDVVDMLVFESFNAVHQHEFSDLDRRAYSADSPEDRMAPAEFGEEKAKIEFKTQLDYLEHLIALKKAGKPIGKLGLKTLKAFDDNFVNDVIPGYSKMTEEEQSRHAVKVKQLKPYTDLTKEERKLKEEKALAFFMSTPHDVKAAYEERQSLNTPELYAYEKVADTQNVKGVRAIFRDKCPKEHPKYELFLETISTIKDSPLLKPQSSWAGKYYDIVSQAANVIFGIALPLFTEHQRVVANAEYATRKGTWADELTSALERVKIG